MSDEDTHARRIAAQLRMIDNGEFEDGEDDE